MKTPNRSKKETKPSWVPSPIAAIVSLIIPGLGLLALLILPYLDQDMNTAGIWFRSINGRWIALISFILGIAGTYLFVFIDEYWLDLPGWLPFLPSVISNGWVPLSAF